MTETKSSDAEWTQVKMFTVDFFQKFSINVVISPCAGEFNTAVPCTFVRVVDPMDGMDPMVSVNVDGLEGEFLFELSRLGVYTVLHQGENKGEWATMIGCDDNRRSVFVLDGTCKKICL